MKLSKMKKTVENRILASTGAAGWPLIESPGLFQWRRAGGPGGDKYHPANIRQHEMACRAKIF
jgi:hypothetical protein